jgi:hypothetical protein
LLFGCGGSEKEAPEPWEIRRWGSDKGRIVVSLARNPFLPQARRLLAVLRLPISQGSWHLR